MTYEGILQQLKKRLDFTAVNYMYNCKCNDGRTKHQQAECVFRKLKKHINTSNQLIF